MTDDAAKARREYLTKWRQDNPDKVRDNMAHYWERKAEKQLQEDGKKATPEEVDRLALEIRRAYFRQWGKENRDKRRAANARYWERKAEQIENEQRASRKG